VEFSAGPSGRANISVRTLLGSVQMVKLQHVF
jgi:hypothetical protein